MRLDSKILISVASVLMMIFVPGRSGSLTSEEINNIEIYKLTSPGVVNITSMVMRYDFFYNPVPQEGTDSGASLFPGNWPDHLFDIAENSRPLQEPALVFN